MRRMKLPLVVAAFLFVCVWGVAADVDFNQTFPSALTTTNPCNGDSVALTGDSHLLVHETQAASGNFEFYIDITSNYAGAAAPSGVAYQGSTRVYQNFSSQGPLPIVLTFYNDVLLHSATNVDNFTLRVHFHFTLNANGTPSASIDDFTTTCNG
jgi:hypothetical protein